VLAGIKKGVKTKIIAIFISASILSFGTKFRAVASVFTVIVEPFIVLKTNT